MSTRTARALCVSDSVQHVLFACLSLYSTCSLRCLCTARALCVSVSVQHVLFACVSVQHVLFACLSLYSTGSLRVCLCTARALCVSISVQHGLNEVTLSAWNSRQSITVSKNNKELRINQTNNSVKKSVVKILPLTPFIKPLTPSLSPHPLGPDADRRQLT